MSAIALSRVSKSYGPNNPRALAALDLTVAQGERLAVLGRSGSGKTTLLRIIAGLEQADEGSVSIGGRDMKSTPPHRRDVAMVFQNPMLYPHLSIRHNMTFGLRARGLARAERTSRVGEMAELLGLGGLLDRRPAELSGGERQRVAIGRAVLRRPRVLLLDEPFASLDIPLRSALRRELLELHRQFGPTLVHVTHDQSEALALGERIAVLHEGRLMQLGTPRQTYDYPDHLVVAAFLGNPGMNFVPCEVERTESAFRARPVGEPRDMGWRFSLDQLGIDHEVPNWPLRLDLGIRPEAIRLLDSTDQAGPGHGGVSVEVTLGRIEFHGGSALAAFTMGRHIAFAWIDAGSGLREGTRAIAVFQRESIQWFDPESGRRLRSAGPSRA